MRKLSKVPVLLVAITLLCSSIAKATHIRAGEITATLIENLTYSFTITGYTDTGSQVQFGGGEIDFGDGTVIDLNTEDYDEKRDLGNEVAINIFRINHTFPGPGEYKITFREFNRNAGVVNMDRSVDTPFYIETTIIIDPLLGKNNTPVLTIPPIDGACTGVEFVHNPGAYDVDGDSLSYKIVIPQQDRNKPVNNYRFPNAEEFGGSQEDGGLPTLFTLDPITGDLIWNSPGVQGEYNMAFIVEEWRKVAGRWRRLGYVTRDMQVIVEECENDPPELEVPGDTCVIAGNLIEEEIIAYDPNGDGVLLESFGVVYNLDLSPAIYAPLPDPPVFRDTAKVDFRWQTVCDHIQEIPYQVRFKATDNGRPQLAEFATWNIQVVAPPPTGLTATLETNRSIRVSWDEYECDRQASHFEIWRRVDSNNFTPGPCDVGMPEGAGYELIGTVDDMGQNFFIDDNNGMGLSFGANYCYRIVAVFPAPAGGESIVSEEVCNYIEASSPVMTNVSVETTAENSGEILVRWTSPFDIDQTEFPPPYSYDLIRSAGLMASGNGTTIASRITDTSFVDTGLNTLDRIYNYLVLLYDAQGEFVDSSAVASSVRLDLSPLVGSIELNWSANTPWSNIAPEHPYHLIYRDRINPADPSELVLMDSVNVLMGGQRYLDDGSATSSELNEDDEYCYYVVTKGVYGNPFISEPLINKSQIACARPNDTIPPCTPVSIRFTDFNSPDECEEFMSMQSCGFNDFFNTLVWSADIAGDCDEDISGYNIYFSETGESGTFEFLDFTRDTTYLHDNLSSFAGCYQLTAVDRSGNESDPSNVICKDNCPQYVLPNVFTPNGDAFNETFRPIQEEPDCPRFVEAVVFRVYNRWGTEVYNSENESNFEQSTLINWDGQTNDGTLVTDGVYYYIAEVTFDVLNPADRVQEIKGWIHIMK